MVTILQRPPEILFSRDHAGYLLHTDKPSNTAGLLIEIALFFRRGDQATFSQVFSQPCYPNQNGDVVFLPAEIINSFLTYEIPVASDGAITDMTSQIGQFYIEYREITTVTPAPVWSSESTTIRNVIKGGLAYERQLDNSFFTTYLPASKQFLTWQVSGRLTSPAETLYLYFLNTSNLTDSIQCKIKIVYRDEDEQLVVIPFPTGIKKYHIYKIPTGIERLGIVLLNKDLFYYEVSVETANGILAAPFRYEIDNRSFYNTPILHYHNSLGGLDSIRLLGSTEPAIERETTINGASTFGELNSNHVYPQLSVQSIKLLRTYTGNTGFIGKLELEGLIDIFFSTSVWWLIGRRWVPANVTNKTVGLPKTNDDLFFITIEYQLGFTNTNYTPQSASI